MLRIIVQLLLIMFIRSFSNLFHLQSAINVKTSQDLVFVTKRNINPFTLCLLKEKLLKVDWELLNTIKDLNEASE